MKYLIRLFAICLLASVLYSCTNARWMVKDRSATDKSEQEILERQYFLQRSEELNPENPILKLDLLSHNKYQFDERVLAQRNIQDYRLRPGFLALSLSGAGLSFYAANSTVLNKSRSSTQMWTLNAVGAVLTAAGFFNMKAVGEPRPTGEERYLRSSGKDVQVDTAQVSGELVANASLVVQYGDITIYEEEDRPITNGQLEIPLAEELNELELKGSSPGVVNVEVNFEDSLYTYEYSVSDILKPYARVSSQLATLHNSPEETPDNVVADLLQESQVEIEDYSDKRWYRVLYGISEHYLLKKHAEIVWQPSDFADEARVVTVPHIPFGEIDVESNIPILQGSRKNALALIITNEDYSGQLEQRKYAHRDGRLIQTYLRDALGYQEKDIYQLKDLGSRSTIDSMLSELRSVSNDSTELIVYLSSYGKIIEETEEPNELAILGSDSETDALSKVIGLNELFEQFSIMTSAKTLVLSDIDFSQSASAGNYTSNQARRIIESQVDNLITNNTNAAVLFGTQLNQPTSLYISSEGEDKKHHIFPYFFAKALQGRMTSISEIYQYLERNVSYTARKLQDHPQDPLLLGNSLLDLVSE